MKNNSDREIIEHTAEFFEMSPELLAEQVVAIIKQYPEAANAISQIGIDEYKKNFISNPLFCGKN